MKVYFDTVGCRLNQAEIEHMAGQFRSAGHEILESAEGADLVVVNSCSVTAAAASDSRQKVRHAHLAGAQRIILTGCWATLEPEKAASLDGVTDVISNIEKATIPQRVLEPALTSFDLEPLARKPLPGSHLRTRAFIKVQDGCNNYCTFCVTRIARGASKSILREDILKEVRLAEEGGVHEIVLSGVHLGSWGREGNSGESITDLIQYLLAHTNVERVRLSSIEPWDLDDRFFELWQNPRMCRHLHLPLQSGSASVLKRMTRHTTPELFAKLVDNARKHIPDAALTTDLIVGFPGETDEEHKETLMFVNQMEFSGGHIFKYSPREGTAAARMPGRINGIVARERSLELNQLIQYSEELYQQKFVNKEVKVLWEASGERLSRGWLLHGLSDNNLRVQARADENRWNRIDTVRIQKSISESLSGEIVYSEP